MSAPPHNERVMLYVRQDGDEVYTPLHVVPPTTQGLLNAVSEYFLVYNTLERNIEDRNNRNSHSRFKKNYFFHFQLPLKP